MHNSFRFSYSAVAGFAIALIAASVAFVTHWRTSNKFGIENAQPTDIIFDRHGILIDKARIPRINCDTINDKCSYDTSGNQWDGFNFKPLVEHLAKAKNNNASLWVHFDTKLKSSFLFPLMYSASATGFKYINVVQNDDTAVNIIIDQQSNCGDFRKEKYVVITLGASHALIEASALPGKSESFDTIAKIAYGSQGLSNRELSKIIQFASLNQAVLPELIIDVQTNSTDVSDIFSLLHIARMRSHNSCIHLDFRP